MKQNANISMHMDMRTFLLIISPKLSKAETNWNGSVDLELQYIFLEI